MMLSPDDVTGPKNTMVRYILLMMVMLGGLFLLQYFAPAPKKEAPHIAPSQKPAVVSTHKNAPHATIKTPLLDGRLSLRGGEIDYLSLRAYRQSTRKDSPPVELLKPDRFFAQFGWASATVKNLPTEDDLWQPVGARTLTPDHPLVLKLSKGPLVYTRTYRIDDRYMTDVTLEVYNRGTTTETLAAYSLVSQSEDTVFTSQRTVVHNGPLGVFNDDLEETDYDDLEDETIRRKTAGGWQGFTDAYWLTAVGLDSGAAADSRMLSNKTDDGLRRYQVDYTLEEQILPPGQTIRRHFYFMGGPKELSLLESYRDTYGLQKLDRSVDFGLWYFITKPLYHLLSFYERLSGSFALSLILLTITVKLVLLPLAWRSFRSISMMRVLQPELARIREAYAKDKQAQAKAMMDFYRRQKVNPLSGCLPMFFQIPVFFSLYKVFNVSINMRHAPFWGWIKDMSAADPTSLFNVFGLLPYHVPSALTVGAWPILMGITMYLQQKVTASAAMDKTQKRLMQWMPVIFTFILAKLPVGVVIYYVWNNILSIIQQVIITRHYEKLHKRPVVEHPSAK